jgi:hypothetical protein
MMSDMVMVFFCCIANAKLKKVLDVAKN